MLAYLFNCIKKRDSTMKAAAPDAMPVGQKFYKTWNQIECQLKAPTSITNPTFIFKPITNPNGTFNYVSNYIYVPKLGRGYWITDWVYGVAVWEAVCHVDVLGSFELPSEPQYVGRSSEEYDPYVRDEFYPLTENIEHNNQEFNWPWATSIDSGRFVVGFISNQAGAIGSVAYYVISSANLKALCQQLMSTTDYMNISATEISQDLQKGLINPMQYIVSCVWVPFVPAVGSEVTTINVGWWSFNVLAHPLLAPLNEILNKDIELPKHPNADTRGEYLNFAPYSSYKLLLNPWGVIDLPTNGLRWKADAAMTLRTRVWCDAISGDAILECRAESDGQLSGVLVDSRARLGVAIQLSQAMQDLYGFGVSTVKSALDYGYKGMQAGAAAGGGGLGSVAGGIAGAAVGAVAGAAIGAAEALPAAMPSISSVGGTGSFINIAVDKLLLSATYQYTTPEDNAHYGRPLCAKRDLRDMTGFVQIVNPHYVAASDATPPTAAEMLEFEQLMGRGFFIESWLG